MISSALEQALVEPITASRPVLFVIDTALRHRLFGFAGVQCGRDGVGSRIIDGILLYHRHRRLVAAADAGYALYAHAVAEGSLERTDQFLATGHFATDRIADPHRQSGRRGLAFAHDIEMMVKRGHLVNFGRGQAHFMRQRGQMRCRQVPVVILDFVQMLDQQIARARLGTQQILYFEQRV
jgi:hypothetical protein